MLRIERQHKGVHHHRQRHIYHRDVTPWRIAQIPLHAGIVLVAMPAPGTVRLMMLPQPVKTITPAATQASRR